MAEQVVKAPGQQAKFVEGNLFRHITVMSLTAILTDQIQQNQ
ncbi:hypothetical protein [Cypionkella sp.]|nr:hypothetical protein [Cypionkella sp.]MDO8985798.1 hypothetical protein [Cypionkella sp.]MDP1575833.1 hypothetical protein [Cypionkella sp.]MDP2051378.1 hypothetical protein [Cypionkella sp.]